MLRGPITASDFKGQFSGHETFPLRHLWLRKAFDAVESGAPRTIFSSPESIVTFGVGKNMALAIRHWALACGVIEERDMRVGATELGRNLFGGERPWDPFMEKAGDGLACAMADRRRPQDDHDVVLGLQSFGGANLRS